ncbi:MarR family winged helix-turn-helix transcriptional regulator [Aquimarina sp. RZ0]|uniref:MarR family winged helix-turn-helix transcriptional regulator n=1 Tax=Aquimarina sp. RZ0 TaxID=2607730 RepID=UPI0011F3D233|nr:MarR family transcriptional regulator [Aquimarina sp. RZ0]KAA1241570.1 MarR family transcriptional regulator [Aquimarina sp. RZ0]
MIEKDIENVVLFQIDKTSKISKQYSQREFDKIKLGITIEQWILLKIIHELRHMSQKELANKSLRDPASITRTLDILEKKELIRREQIPNNRRQYNISLTPNGANFVEKNINLITEHRKKSIEGFSKEEIETLKSFLLRIQKNMS